MDDATFTTVTTFQELLVIKFIPCLQSICLGTAGVTTWCSNLLTDQTATCLRGSKPTMCPP